MSPMLADQRVEGVRKLKPLAEKLGCSLAQLALAWCCKNPHVSSVLTGATKHEQVCGSFECLGHIMLHITWRGQHALYGWPQHAETGRL